MDINALIQLADQSGLPVYQPKPVEKPKDYFSTGLNIGLKQLEGLSKEGYYCYPQRALSYSSIKGFYLNPVHYFDYIAAERTDSDAMKLGKVFEAILFNQFRDLFILYNLPNPDKDLRDGTNKNYVNSLNLQIADEHNSRAMLRAAKENITLEKARMLEQKKEVVSQQIFNKAIEMAESCNNHPFVSKMMNSLPIFGSIKTDEIIGIKMTARPDALFTDENGLHGIDIKTIDSIADFYYRLFGRRSDYQYWIQAAIYCTLYNFNRFSFVVTQSKKPYLTAVYTFTEEKIKHLKDKLICDVLIPFKQCLDNGFINDDYDVDLPDNF